MRSPALAGCSGTKLSSLVRLFVSMAIALPPLVAASCPVTVKQLRSWLGAAKQLSAGLNNYAVVFQPLEQLVAGKTSAEKVSWTDESQSNFQKAKDLVATVKGIFYPLPSDRITTYSDYSEAANSVGGRLEFTRMEGGKEILACGVVVFIKVIDYGNAHPVVQWIQPMTSSDFEKTTVDFKLVFESRRLDSTCYLVTQAHVQPGGISIIKYLLWHGF